MATRAVARAQQYHGGPKATAIGGGKRLGAGAPAPAWRGRNMPAGAKAGKQARSKVLLSNLPVDVDEEEIVDLMRKSIGPVVAENSLMVYNVKGFPRGMAIVAFQRQTDAAKARETFNGKIIDGKRPIKLEIIVDEAPAPAPAQTGPPRQKSLFERIGNTGVPQPQPQQGRSQPARPPNPAGTKRPAVIPVPYRPPQPAAANGALAAPVRKKQKKGPKRIKKTVQDLDQEMEEYNAARAIPQTA